MKTLLQLARDVDVARQNLADAIAALRRETDRVAGAAGTETPEPRKPAKRATPTGNLKPRGKAVVRELTEDLVKEYHAKGLNDVAIAAACGVSPRRVQRMRAALGLKGKNGRPKTPSDDEPLPPIAKSGMPKKPAPDAPATDSARLIRD